MPLQWKHRVLTIEPSGKPPSVPLLGIYALPTGEIQSRTEHVVYVHGAHLPVRVSWLWPRSNFFSCLDNERKRGNFWKEELSWLLSLSSTIQDRNQKNQKRRLVALSNYFHIITYFYYAHRYRSSLGFVSLSFFQWDHVLCIILMLVFPFRKHNRFIVKLTSS